MDRCKDYAAFIVSFAGLGYIAVWPLSAGGIGGIGFGAAWSLPPALHMIGLLSAGIIGLRMLSLAIRPWRRSRTAAAAPAPAPDIAARLQPMRWKAPSGAAVKPRSQFGLRGIRQ